MILNLNILKRMQCFNFLISFRKIIFFFSLAFIIYINAQFNSLNVINLYTNKMKLNIPNNFILLFFLDQRQKSKGASSSCCSAACSIL